MDSNVSKNTNSHNFFKLEVERELGISVKNILKRELLLILNSARQKFSDRIKQKSLASILENKISISNHRYKSTKHGYDSVCIAKTEFIPIVYSCPIGLLLAANRSPTPQMIMQQIRQLLSGKQEETDSELLCSNSLSILIEIVDRGWINFYLSSQFVSVWLQQSLVWHQQEVNIEANSLKPVSAELFSEQYIHARCCSLLNLGEREKLIILSPDAALITTTTGNTISWLNDRGELYLNTTAELNLIRQLLYLTDSWMKNQPEEEWSSLARNLCQSIALFLANCRFLGEVRVEYPQLAIARLGLIFLVQIWLGKILRQKLGIAALEEM